MSIQLQPLTPSFGASISGIDISNGIDDTTFKEILKIFNQYGLIVIRGQNLSVENQVKFGRRFGVVQIHVMNQYHVNGHPEVYYLSNLDDEGNPNGKHPDRGTMY
jgi:taurine dioxygenase